MGLSGSLGKFLLPRGKDAPNIDYGCALVIAVGLVAALVAILLVTG